MGSGGSGRRIARCRLPTFGRWADCKVQSHDWEGGSAADSAAESESEESSIVKSYTSSHDSMPQCLDSCEDVDVVFTLCPNFFQKDNVI